MTYLADTIYLNNLYQEQSLNDPFIKEAGFVGDILTGIVDYGKSVINSIKEDPISGILSFIGGGLLLKLGFPWLAAAYEIAGALGFDWAGFWKSIKDSVVSIFKDAFSGKKPTEEELHQRLVSETNANIDRNMRDTVDEEELKRIHSGSAKVSANSYTDSFLVKEAGIFGGAAKGAIAASRGLLSKVFKRVIPWALTTFFISAGLAVASGAAIGALGLSGPAKSGPAEDAKLTRDPIYDIPTAANIPDSITKLHRNEDATSIWMEAENIGDIKGRLSSWILQVFPSLNNEISKIQSSQPFMKVENEFMKRNAMALNLNVYSIPKPYQSKLDIVKIIVNEYLKTKGSNAPTTS